MRNSFKYGFIALALSAPLAQKAIAQEQPSATIRLACKGVADDALKTDIEVSVNIAVVNANIDRRERGVEEIPRFSFKDMPEEPTRKFIAELRAKGTNGFGGPGFGVVIKCNDKPAP